MTIMFIVIVSWFADSPVVLVCVCVCDVGVWNHGVFLELKVPSPHDFNTSIFFATFEVQGVFLSTWLLFDQHCCFSWAWHTHPETMLACAYIIYIYIYMYIYIYIYICDCLYIYLSIYLSYLWSLLPAAAVWPEFGLGEAVPPMSIHLVTQVRGA